MKVKKLQHTKIKNTGIIWELLVRQLTSDILNENKNIVAADIIKKYFNKNTELYKEYKVYDLLINNTKHNEYFIQSLINESMTYCKSLDLMKLKKEKYNLIKEIKENYDINLFFKTTIPNYKTLATIYKLMTLQIESNIIPEVGEYTLLIENLKDDLMKKKKQSSKNILYSDKKYVENKMIFKILIENFNKKYNNLNDAQKNIIRLFIMNSTNNSTLKEHLLSSISDTKKLIKENIKHIQESDLKIKIKYILKKMENTNKKIENNNINDNLLTEILEYIELEKLLKEYEKCSNE